MPSESVPVVRVRRRFVSFLRLVTPAEVGVLMVFLRISSSSRFFSRESGEAAAGVRGRRSIYTRRIARKRGKRQPTRDERYE
ncbi:hypothetical protein NDU88_000520 [Pleurodeles waltl]|uniref:Uncharacterized protein n=1 Tax=Pleurodeles waltl TaxID=8319 RepID=A0AAV7NAM2_PLEWA|nr:hypothetical protein NDU88_000520 [Pleurodeles waltl]